MLFAMLSLSWKKPDTAPTSQVYVETQISLTDNSVKEAEALYKNMDLEKRGLSADAFSYAYKGYKNLEAKGKLSSNFLTICDFSQPSGKKRFYLLDLEKNELLIQTFVAHGKNSGAAYATKFSNTPESLQSSLGFYLTKQTYNGAHGLSLRMEGLEPGYNNNAMRRNIVVHGADYAEESWLRNSSYIGRSFGCPAIPASESKEIIETIKNGTCIFIYHPDAKYLKGSKILNG